MADKTINQLPVSDGLTDNGLLVVYQNDQAQSIEGRLIKQFAKEGVEEFVGKEVATMDKVNEAIEAAIGTAIGGSY